MKKTLLTAILGLATSVNSNAQGHLAISNYLTPPYNQVVYNLDPLAPGPAVNDTNITFQLFYGKGDDPADCIHPGTTFHILGNSQYNQFQEFDPGAGHGPGGFFYVIQVFPDWQPGDVYTLMYKVIDPEWPGAQSVYWSESAQIVSVNDAPPAAAFVPGLALITSGNPLTHGLVGYYPFTGNANDESGGGHGGDVVGASLSPNRLGVGETAYEFNGSNLSNVIVVPSLAAENLPELTLSVWVRASSYPPEAGTIVTKARGYSASLEDYSLSLRQNLRVSFSNGRHGTGYRALPNHCQITTPNHLTLDQWHHIVATLDSAGTGTVWVDGILSATDNILPLLPPETEPVRIGQSKLADRSPFFGANVHTFHGMIDDVRIYNRALSPVEIQHLYEYESSSEQQPSDLYRILSDERRVQASASGWSPFDVQSQVNTNTPDPEFGLFTGHAWADVEGTGWNATADAKQNSGFTSTGFSASGTVNVSAACDLDGYGQGLVSGSASALSAFKVQFRVLEPCAFTISGTTHADMATPAGGQGQISLKRAGAGDLFPPGETIVTNGLLPLGDYTLEAQVASSGAAMNFQSMQGRGDFSLTFNFAALPTMITANPVSRTNVVGSSLMLSVNATGSGVLSYQWFKDWELLPGATTRTLILTNLSLGDAGAYVVVVNALGGPAASVPAMVTVLPLDSPGVLAGPVVNPANGHAYYLLAQSTWVEAQHVATTMGGHLATLRSQAEQDFVFSNFGNWGGQLRHLCIGLQDPDPMSNAADPADRRQEFTWISGEPVTYSHWDAGEPNNWLENGEFWVHIIGPDPGVPERAGFWNDVSDTESNTFTVRASLHGVVEIKPPPFIVENPRRIDAVAGQTVQFAVQATGALPLHYQWRLNGTNLNGAIGNTLVVANIKSSDAGLYSVVVTNLQGKATSSDALLTVGPAPVSRVRVVSTNGAPGSTIAVPIQLISIGKEKALGFSLEFNPNLLSLQEARLGANAIGGALLENSSQTNAGRFGLLISAPSGQVFHSGTNEVAVVVFACRLTNDAQVTLIGFGDQPTSREVVDELALRLPATFEAGTLSLVPTAYEADVAPRGAVDRKLTVADWVQAGRFATALDTPTGEWEFQRADCAPREILGDGRISAIDWVQAGRYAVGLDPLTFSGGPTAVLHVQNMVRKGGDGKVAVQNAEPERAVSVGEAALLAGSTNAVSVSVQALGGEAAFTFSVHFDPENLTYLGATPGSGAVLNLNTASVASGNLGVGLSLPIGSSLEPGTAELLKLQFAVAPSADGTTAIEFGDNPISRETSDAAANPLPTAYHGGTLNILPLRPLLGIAISTNQVTLSWPALYEGFQLEQNTNSAPAQTGWTGLGVQPVAVGGRYSVTVTNSGSAVYFRLQKP